MNALAGIATPWPRVTCSWEEIEEDRYLYNEGLGLSEFGDGPANDVQHFLAMERVFRSRDARELLRWFEVEVFP